MAAESRSIRAVLFDAVGTLIYPRVPVAETYHVFGQRHGCELPPAEIVLRFRAAISQFRDDHATNEPREQARWRGIVGSVFGLSDGSPQLAGLFRDLWQYYATSAAWSVYDDVAATWRALTERGLTLGVASNFDVRLESVCRGLFPLDSAEHVFYSSAIGFPKPRREFFLAVQERLRLEPAQILLIGDDLDADYHGARAAGWHALLIDRDGVVSNQNTIVSLAQLREWCCVA